MGARARPQHLARRHLKGTMSSGSSRLLLGRLQMQGPQSLLAQHQHQHPHQQLTCPQLPQHPDPGTYQCLCCPWAPAPET